MTAKENIPENYSESVDSSNKTLEDRVKGLEAHARDATYQNFVQLRAVMVRAVGLGWRDEKFQTDFMQKPEEALKKAFGYEFPFSFEMKIRKAKDFWTPESTGGWSGENNELHMFLPPKPKNKKDAAEALAAYNDMRLNLISE